MADRADKKLDEHERWVLLHWGELPSEMMVSRKVVAALLNLNPATLANRLCSGRVALEISRDGARVGAVKELLQREAAKSSKANEVAA